MAGNSRKWLEITGKCWCLALGGRPKSEKPAPLGGRGASQDEECGWGRSCAQGKVHGKGWARRCISGPVGYVVYIGGTASKQSWSRNWPSLAASSLDSRRGRGGRRGPGKPPLREGETPLGGGGSLCEGLGRSCGLEVRWRPAAEGGDAPVGPRAQPGPGVRWRAMARALGRRQA